MFDFQPSLDSERETAPYFEDVSKQAGWAGHSTTKSLSELQSQIAAAIGRLGGMVVSWQPGTVRVDNKERDAFRVFMAIQNADGVAIPGQFTVAALPVRTSSRNALARRTQRDKALKMALFNLRDQLETAWRMQHLIPGLSALLPFMLDSKSKQPYYMVIAEKGKLTNLLPAVTESDVLDAAYEEVE